MPTSRRRGLRWESQLLLLSLAGGLPALAGLTAVTVGTAGVK